MKLPSAIPTVRVTATYLGPDGRPLKGTVTFTGPGLLTFAESNLFLAGPVVGTLDELGQLIDAAGNVGVTLPATDAPDMNPTDWAWVVKESLTGVVGSRTYAMLLPAATPGGEVDLADVAPANPSGPNYVPVPGYSAYDLAVQNGFVGTLSEWLTSLHGADGTIGHDGAPGVIQSVNGKSAASVTLTAADVQAVATALLAAANGVATLDSSGKLVAAQKPTYTASDVNAVATALLGANNGVAQLDGTGKLTAAQRPTVGQVTSVKKSTEYGVASNVTPAADAELTIAVAANAVYDVELACAWTNGGGGFRATWSGPSGASMVWTDNDGVGVTTLSGNVTFSGTSGTTLKGTLTVGATAGSLAFMWAQGTSNAGATTLRAGCALKLLRLS